MLVSPVLARLREAASVRAASSSGRWDISRDLKPSPHPAPLPLSSSGPALLVRTLVTGSRISSGVGREARSTETPPLAPPRAPPNATLTSSHVRVRIPENGTALANVSSSPDSDCDPRPGPEAQTRSRRSATSTANRASPAFVSALITVRRTVKEINLLNRFYSILWVKEPLEALTRSGEL